MRCPYCNGCKLVKAYINGKLEVCSFYPATPAGEREIEINGVKKLYKYSAQSAVIMVHTCDALDIDLKFKNYKEVNK